MGLHTHLLLEMVRAGAAASSAGYGDELQIQAAQWIESVTGEALEGEDFADSLRSGIKLCDLINTIQPGAVKRVNRKEGQNKFKQMENISSFIKACRELGVKEYSLFETVDLYEGKDVGLVVKCLHALGGTAQLECPDFPGPHLGLKPVSRTSPRKKAPAWSTPSSSTPSAPASSPARKTWSTPSSGQPSTPIAALSSPPSSLPQDGPRARIAASGAAATSYSAPSPAATEPPPPFDHAVSTSNGAADETVPPPPPPPFDDTAPRWGSGEIRPSAIAAAAATVGSSPAGGGGGGARTPPPPYRDDLSSTFANSARVADRSSGSISPRGGGGGSGNKGSSQAARPPSPPYRPPQSYGFSQQQQPPPQARGRSRSPPRAQGGMSAVAVPPAAAPPADAEPPVTVKAASATSATSSPHRSPVGGRGGGYGLDAELAAKREANYDHDAEREAQEWIENVTGEPFADEFAEELKDGQRLCNLINTIKPGAVRRVNASKMPFKQMENVSNFLKACRAVGVAEHSLFETVDLFEGKDLGLVVRCLHALGQTVQKSCPEYDGPRLGIRQTEANKREWTAEQQQQQLLNSSGAMSQLMAGSSKTMERGAVIKTGVTFGAAQSGTGDPSAASGWTMGSAATMERSHIVKSGPTYGAEYAGASGDTSGASSRFTAGHRL